MRSTRSYSGQHVVEGVVHRGLLFRVERVHLNPPKRRMGGGVVRLPPIPISRVIQRMSANVDDARLGRRLCWRFRLCRKLKHRCLLTLMQVRQENKRAIRKFECVVMPPVVRPNRFVERSPFWSLLFSISCEKRRERSAKCAMAAQMS